MDFYKIDLNKTPYRYKMTKYDKSIIYKICCKDLSIQDIYVGSTTNFRNRKYEHKKCCNNSQIPNYKLYKYEFIRNNGGWNNWEMIQIKNFPCNSKRELEAEERKVFDELKPTLNCIRPQVSCEEAILTRQKRAKSKIHCECGSIIAYSVKARHERTKKHKNFLDTLYNGI